MPIGSGVVAGEFGGGGNSGGGGGGGLPLTTASGVLGSPYTLTGSTTTFLTTSSLATGTWLVEFSCEFDTLAAGDAGVQIAAGTATATFAGPVSTDSYYQRGDGFDFVSGEVVAGNGFTCIASVSVAGTLVFQAKGVSGSILSSGKVAGVNCTGYAAEKIG
jgi:hypothetical protein